MPDNLTKPRWQFSLRAIFIVTGIMSLVYALVINAPSLLALGLILSGPLVVGFGTSYFAGRSPSKMQVIVALLISIAIVVAAFIALAVLASRTG